MKKHFLPLALAAVAMLGAASVSAQVTRTWDGGGTTESFFEAANWTANTLPTSIDNIVFNGTSSKNCIMDANVQVNNITVGAAYGGAIYLDGTGIALTANNLSLNGAYFQLGVQTGASTLATVTISNNGWLNAASKNGFTATTLNLDLAGYFSAYSKATVNFTNINIDPYGQFKAPQEGKVILANNFTKHKNSTYDHRKSTLVLNGPDFQEIHLSQGAGQTNGSCDFWNVELNKTNQTLASDDNIGVTATDTMIAGNRMTIIDGDHNSGQIGIADTLVHLGQGAQGHAGNFHFIGSKNGDIILSGGNTLGNYDYIIAKQTNTTPVNVWKGASTNILLRANVFVNQGDLRFDEDVEATVFGNMTVNDDGTLTMPSAGYLNLNDNLTASSGSIINPRMGTLAFINTGTHSLDLGAPKAFYNIEFNTAASGGAIVPNGNDTLVALHNVKLIEGQMSGSGTGNILLVEGDLQALSSISDNINWTNPIAFVGSGNSDYTAEVGIPMPTAAGAAGIVVNKATHTAKVIVGAGSASIATVGDLSNVYVRNGVFEFTGKSRIAVNAAPGLVVSGGTISAPSGDTLFVRGSWNFYGAGAFTHNGGTIELSGTSSDDFTHNNSAVKFNNMVIRTQSMEWGANPNTTTDTVWVEGDLTLTNSGDLVNVSLVFEGDFTTEGSNSNPTLDENAIAAGSANQVITLGGVGQLQAEGLMINKSGGKVNLGSAMTLDFLNLKNGNISPGANTLTVAGANNIAGGNAGSFVDGRLFITANSQWSGSRYLLPIGRGSSYRPVQLHNSSTTNNWNVEYVAGDTSAAGSLAGGLDAVSTTEYWRINRTSGGSGTFNVNNATYIELSLNGKNGSWDNADVRVASLSGGNWNNLGQLSIANNRIMSSGTAQHNNVSGVFTLGLETPAPARIVNGVAVSGQEVSTTSTQAAVAAQVANGGISFTVFPNPVGETLNFSVQGSDKGIVTLSDLSGKVIGTYNVAEVRSIAVGHLAAGVYFATYTDGVNRIAQRVIRH